MLPLSDGVVISTGTPSKLSIFADSIEVDAESRESEADFKPDPKYAVKLVSDFVVETKNQTARKQLEKVLDGLDLVDISRGGANGGQGGTGSNPEPIEEEADDLLDLMDSAV